MSKLNKTVGNDKKLIFLLSLFICVYIAAVDHLDWFNQQQSFAIGYMDGTIKLGKIIQNTNIITCKAHENEITALKWNHQGALLATTSADLTCKVFI